MSIVYRSPLRYPGGKSSLTPYLEYFLRKNLLTGTKFVEPYAGGAGVSLGLFSQDVIAEAIWVERDPLIYSFWKAVFESPDQLCSTIEETDTTLDTWHQLRPLLDKDAMRKFSLNERAFAGLFFNRTNFSGILNANPIGGINQNSAYAIDCRFNKKRIIAEIRKISTLKKRVSIYFGDATNFLEKHKDELDDGDTVVYVDPPYLVQGGRLYRYSYTENEHEDLAKFMDAQTYPWIVSIDNHPRILEFYKNQQIVPIFFSYAVRQARRTEELIISNLKIDNPTLALEKISTPEDLGVLHKPDSSQASCTKAS